MEARGAVETAYRALKAAGAVIRDGVQQGYCASDPTRDLNGAIARFDFEGIVRRTAEATFSLEFVKIAEEIMARRRQCGGPMGVSLKGE